MTGGAVMPFAVAAPDRGKALPFVFCSHFVHDGTAGSNAFLTAQSMNYAVVTTAIRLQFDRATTIRPHSL